MSVVFISDLHLDAKHPEISEIFCKLIDQSIGKIDALYILGDFFNTWLGDNDSNEFIEHIKQQLKKLTTSNIPVYFMRGNRDFLIGKKFLEETGCQFLPDPTVIDLYGTKTLLMHGDTLCTKDKTYLAFRKVVQSPLFRFSHHVCPLFIRRGIANALRKISRSSNKNHKAAEILDVTPEEIPRVMREHKVTQLIHGHTHRPSIHYIFDSNEPLLHIVLSDWHESGHMLICKPNGQLRLIPIKS